jgi:hypothetical protein
MSKYSPEIVKKICGMLEKDSYTVEEVCANVGIDEATIMGWRLLRYRPKESPIRMLNDIERMINNI